MYRLLIALLASVALAAPTANPAAEAAAAAKPQLPYVNNTLFAGIGDAKAVMVLAGSVVNDNDDDKTCRDAYFVVARGSMEPASIGVTVGPQLCKGLKAKFGTKIGCQGMTATEYSAAIWDNLAVKGTSQGSIDGGVAVFKRVNAKCPNALLVTTGYSQGAALLHNVVPLLPDNIKEKLVGAVLFGDTRNKQSNATLDGFPLSKTIAFCTKEDGVCWGGLTVTSGHLAYMTNGDEQRAIDFLVGKLNGAGLG